ncbi:hypothetical protein [Ferrimonas balearica]|uniref:hypothetical protein n=1 Tax=Ferrimonas balearica TaxID=44012 RepID=UPI001C98E998|nr:hypothetical protein [Ferrimonas balearica]MBY5991527.1 hypothetical protein [Ferrimonas balearica]
MVQLNPVLRALLLGTSILLSPLAGANTPDLSVHSRETSTPIGRLSHQSEALQKALVPFIERCREAGAQLYQLHEGNFPYGPEGQPHQPLEQAWYLPGAWHDELNPNMGITMSVKLHAAQLLDLSVGHLLISGTEPLAEMLAKQNRRYIEQRGGPAIACDVMISGLVGQGESQGNETVRDLLAALDPAYRIHRQRLTLLLDSEVLITRNELHGRLGQPVNDQNADMAHQRRAARIERTNNDTQAVQAETTWRLHGERQPGSYARIKLNDRILYRCDLQIDGDGLHSLCVFERGAEAWGFNQLGDEGKLVQSVDAALAELKASKDDTVDRF